jgi:uncharacterized Zn-finger protein
MLFSRAFTKLCLCAAVALLAGLPVARAGGEGLPGLPPADPMAHEVAAVGMGLPERPERYNCDQCFSRFYNPRSLARHMRMHTGERPYACDLCGSAFAHRGNLVRHSRTHQAPAAPEILLPGVDPSDLLPGGPGGVAGDPAGGRDCQ